MTSIKRKANGGQITNAFGDDVSEKTRQQRET